jgi:RNA polymerase sigma factor (TIGR02999 family)
MPAETSQPVTQLLNQWSRGDQQALEHLSALRYDELRQLAQRHLRRERGDRTSQQTALVNEAFVRLVAQQSVDWKSRVHFFALASELMRGIRGISAATVKRESTLACACLRRELLGKTL